eukprot:TRINITY_DN67555_c11_g1_i1.p1 TRINITY_DN67555_c11_g1~~TRINITY_DN67555_c11_g1_i1.p1  ORF type:complete len:440 (+),score=20.10 TRINITY_DN67555_c11_g1_i1:85-1404(+)
MYSPSQPNTIQSLLLTTGFTSVFISSLYVLIHLTANVNTVSPYPNEHLTHGHHHHHYHTQGEGTASRTKSKARIREEHGAVRHAQTGDGSLPLDADKMQRVDREHSQVSVDQMLLKLALWDRTDGHGHREANLTGQEIIDAVTYNFPMQNLKSQHDWFEFCHQPKTVRHFTCSDLPSFKILQRLGGGRQKFVYKTQFNDTIYIMKTNKIMATADQTNSKPAFQPSLRSLKLEQEVGTQDLSTVRGILQPVGWCHPDESLEPDLIWTVFPLAESYQAESATNFSAKVEVLLDFLRLFSCLESFYGGRSVIDDNWPGQYYWHNGHVVLGDLDCVQTNTPADEHFCKEVADCTSLHEEQEARACKNAHRRCDWLTQHTMVEQLGRRLLPWKHPLEEAFSAPQRPSAHQAAKFFDAIMHTLKTHAAICALVNDPNGTVDVVTV